MDGSLGRAPCQAGEPFWGGPNQWPGNERGTLANESTAEQAQTKSHINGTDGVYLRSLRMASRSW